MWIKYRHFMLFFLKNDIYVFISETKYSNIWCVLLPDTICIEHDFLPLNM